MPKRRNHPHHHRQADRALRTGHLRLPVSLLRAPDGVTRYLFPPGWRARPQWEVMARLYGYYALVGVAVVAIVFGCVGILALVGWLFGPH
jgi:hypothetical protein